jgi:CheY-like chemotaxis protein
MWMNSTKKICNEECAGSRRVLVADDDRQMARGLKLMLELWGCEVAVAHDGLSALAAVRELRPHAALLDIGLPRLDGLQVARAIRQETALREVRLVAVTGYDDERHRRLSRDAGFDQHLVKPIDPGALREALLAVG